MSKRLKRRYLALQIASEESINKRDFVDALWEALLKFFGEYGASQAGLRLIEYHSQNKYAIVRCLNEALQMVRASIASITEINEKHTAIHVIRVSGTLKALRKKAQLAELQENAD